MIISRIIFIFDIVLFEYQQNSHKNSIPQKSKNASNIPVRGYLKVRPPSESVFEAPHRQAERLSTRGTTHRRVT